MVVMVYHNLGHSKQRENSISPIIIYYQFKNNLINRYRTEGESKIYIIVKTHINGHIQNIFTCKNINKQLKIHIDQLNLFSLNFSFCSNNSNLQSKKIIKFKLFHCRLDFFIFRDYNLIKEVKRMTPNELLELLTLVRKTKAETQTLEIKSAAGGCPAKIYDTLSSFSNQDDGGIILFGLDETNDFEEKGVYDAHDLQKHLVEQCNQMEPRVKPVLTVVSKDEKVFVSAEIPGIDISERPCFYAGRGRLRGSYIRLGDADEPMNEYEIYSYEAFRKKYEDDVRTKENIDKTALSKILLDEYLLKLKLNKANLAQLSDERILELMNMTRNGVPTLASVLMFSDYPQAFFPQLCIIATAIPGTKMGDIGADGERFIDNKRIEGTLSQMLDEAMMFVRKNTKVMTIIDSVTGERIDRYEYPPVAVREAILNSLIHRDYSIHTEGMPIQLVIYEDRLEITNPGGLYGRISINQLGKIQPDTRNPAVAVTMEILNKTENRYSGIPTIRRELRKASMPEPIFKDLRGSFIVSFYKKEQPTVLITEAKNKIEQLLEFCSTFRTRKEIADFLHIKTLTHAIKSHVMPLVEEGLMEMEFPDRPRSSKQRYKAAKTPKD